MAQLQLFSKKELAAMRDRTRSRHYSPAGEEFRREHERHRAWGLARRHAEKLRRAHAGTPPPTTAGHDREGPAEGPVPSEPQATVPEQKAHPITGTGPNDRDTAAHQTHSAGQLDPAPEHRSAPTPPPQRRLAGAATCESAGGKNSRAPA